MGSHEFQGWIQDTLLYFQKVDAVSFAGRISRTKRMNLTHYSIYKTGDLTSVPLIRGLWTALTLRTSTSVQNHVEWLQIRVAAFQEKISTITADIYKQGASLLTSLSPHFRVSDARDINSCFSLSLPPVCSFKRKGTNNNKMGCTCSQFTAQG